MPEDQINKTFSAPKVEPLIYNKWDVNNLFYYNEIKKTDYSILMPPLNITGDMHIGHALCMSIQDTLIRYNRMIGKNILFQSGLDHAGIATQILVEKLLAEENNNKNYNKEQFFAKAQEWKSSCQHNLIDQLKNFGISANWQRNRFTMDDDFTNKVKSSFIQLYNDGLIYRSKQLVNFNCDIKTAISDLEVSQKEIIGNMWYIDYYIIEKDCNIAIATTRPETLFADVAIAINPNDTRYKGLEGCNVKVPLSGAIIPIVIDEGLDIEKGSGVVKISPAHDFYDFEVAKRLSLPLINILDQNGNIKQNFDIFYFDEKNDRIVENNLQTQHAPDNLVNLDRLKAREIVVEQLEYAKLISRVESVDINLPYHDRSNSIIEPMLTDQWFIDTSQLAPNAIKVVEDNEIIFFPEKWKKDYLNWLYNIKPWCISRQILWGHSIPAWYCINKDNHIFVAEDEAQAYEQAKKYYNCDDIVLKQDSDVLDTWFSSALWPLITLDWQGNKTIPLHGYPTNVLVTGFDIIFFWVARMIMMSLYFTKTIPFKHIYIHPLIRDKFGQKMSKSKGNTINVTSIIKEYGVDVVRIGLLSYLTPGRDIKINNDVFTAYKGLCIKLWNAYRFCIMNSCDFTKEHNINNFKHPINIWIVDKIINFQNNLDNNIQQYRFNDAANTIYSFVWNVFCDWFIELNKVLLKENTNQELTDGLAWTLKQILILCHPFIPYITESIWDQIGNKNNILALQKINKIKTNNANNIHVEQVRHAIKIIKEIRSIRSNLNIIDKDKVILLTTHNDFFHEDIKKCIIQLANLSDFKITDIIDKKATATFIINQNDYFIDLNNIIDIQNEKNRLLTQLESYDKKIKTIQNKLQNNEFINKAPKNIINKTKQNLDHLNQSYTKLLNSIKSISL